VADQIKTAQKFNTFEFSQDDSTVKENPYFNSVPSKFETPYPKQAFSAKNQALKHIAGKRGSSYSTLTPIGASTQAGRTSQNSYIAEREDG